MSAWWLNECLVAVQAGVNADNWCALRCLGDCHLVSWLPIHLLYSILYTIRMQVGINSRKGIARSRISNIQGKLVLSVKLHLQHDQQYKNGFLSFSLIETFCRHGG
jgi:hypothetical protein